MDEKKKRSKSRTCTDLDNYAAAANDLAGLALLVKLAKARPFTQLLGVINLHVHIQGNPDNINTQGQLATKSMTTQVVLPPDNVKHMKLAKVTKDGMIPMQHYPFKTP